MIWPCISACIDRMSCACRGGSRVAWRAACSTARYIVLPGFNMACTPPVPADAIARFAHASANVESSCTASLNDPSARRNADCW